MAKSRIFCKSNHKPINLLRLDSFFVASIQKNDFEKFCGEWNNMTAQKSTVKSFSSNPLGNTTRLDVK